MANKNKQIKIRMDMNRKIRTWLSLIFIAGIVFISFVLIFGFENGVNAEYTLHEPIYINGNSQFTSENGVSSGNGTEDKPYIIEGWDISANSKNGIEIENTDAYFMIINCFVHHFDGESNTGIYFKNVKNGKIENCEIKYNFYGINLVSSSLNIITNNIISENQVLKNPGPYAERVGYSIVLSSSSTNNTINNNQIYDNWVYGIWLSSSSNNTINNNQIYDNWVSGIWLSSSSKNNINNNIIFNNGDGIYLSSSSNNNINSNNNISNNGNGFYLISSSSNNIKDNQFSENQYGINFDSSSNNNIANNNISNNYWIGIYSSSSSNYIDNNTISNNMFYGVYLYFSSNNTMRNNSINNNKDVESSYNFGVYGNKISYYYQDIDTSNKVNGKVIYYIQDQKNLIFDGKIKLGGFLAFISCNNITVKDSELESNRDGVLFINSTNNTVLNSRIYNNEYYGIYILDSSNNRIINNTISPHNQYGIYLYNSSNNNIKDNNISQNGCGIYLSSSSKNNSMINNIIFNNRYGIYLDSSQNNNIANNDISNAFYYGIYLFYSSNNKITKNYISKNNNGIFVISSSNIDMNDNTIFNNANGIYLNNSQNIDMNYNTIFNNANGIYLYNSTNDNILNNIAFNNTEGIYLYYSPNNNIIGNNVSDNMEGIMLYNSKNDILNNTFFNNNYAISLYETSNINIANNNIYGNDLGIYFHLSLKNNIKSNNISENSVGIYLTNPSKYNNINNNSIFNNGDGIDFYSSNNNIENNSITFNNVYGISFSFSSNNNINNNAIFNNGDGIYSIESSNNKITNNYVSNNDNGIYLYTSSSNNINNNEITFNGNGIYLYYFSNYNYITNNYVSNNDNGIYLYTSSNIEINDNYVYSNNYYGIYLYSLTYIIMKNNNIDNNKYNFGILGTEILHYYQDIDTSNKINGKPIYYIKNQNSLIFDGSIEVGYLGFVSCNNITVKNYELKNNYQGILFVNTKNSLIIDNNIYNNEYGIYFINSQNIDINNTIISNSFYDFYLMNSINNTAINTTFNANKVYADASQLIVKNYLQVKVIDYKNLPIQNATISIKDNNNEIFNDTTDYEGKIPQILITDRIYYSNNATENITEVSVYYYHFNFENNPRDVNMSFSHLEIFKTNEYFDLTPISLNIPTNYYENEQIIISSLIQNLGERNAINFTVSLIINNQTIQTKTISLNANSSSLISFNYTVQKGNHEIKISIDKENKIIETNETNNEISFSISVFPNLNWQVSISNSNPYENEVLKIKAKIINSGNGNADNITVSLLLNGFVIESKTLTVFAFSQEEIEFNWTAVRGNNIIRIEINGTNLSKEFKFLALPDLTPILFTSHERILIGDNMTISAIIKNIGNANAENFVVRFYIDGINVQNFTISLNFNENATLSFNFTFEKGNHTIRVVVDEENFVLELNEGNNNASLEIVGNEKVNGNANSFYMNFFIIIGIAGLVGVIRKFRIKINGNKLDSIRFI